MHKMFGQDPRHLRPADRSEMNNRFKLVHKRSKRGRNSGKHAEQEVGVLEVESEAHTPAFSDTTRFGDLEDLRSPQQDSVYSMSSDLASPSTLASMSPIGPNYSAVARDDLPNPPFPAPSRNDTVFSTSTQMSTNSVRRIRSRLSVTTIFAKQVDVLMKRLTISGSNNQGIPSPRRSFSDIPVHQHGRSDLVPHPGLSVPGDFIVARKYVQACSHQKHFADVLKEGKCACWCVIADEASDSPDNFYITDGEDWCDRASHVLHGNVEASCADHFGNTPLHLFASLKSQLGIDTTLSLVESKRSNPVAVNNAGQTALHVLSAAWFSRLDDPDAPLYRLLRTLWYMGDKVSKAVFLRDVYGRTFFHRLARFVHDTKILTEICRPYSWASIPRDAFGVKPPEVLADPSISGPGRTGNNGLSSLAEEPKEEISEMKHRKLIHTLNGSYENHALEDDKGRNGLHCLAEVELDPPTPSAPTRHSSNQGSQKRKRGASDASDSSKPVERRAHFLETLLIQTASGSVKPPDVNHYNKAGHTVLMAFATHLTDATDRNGTHTGRILDLLLTHGAQIDMRNRDGETALLMAARRGNKNVVSKLLERGANLHARDKNGRGVMGVLDARIASCGQRGRSLSEYGRLEAVRAVLAKVVLEMGGEDEPGFLNEWCWTTGVQA